jgi:hypothetical protein
MKSRIALAIIFMMFILSIPINAGGKEELQKYFNDVANKVKSTENPSEKREILNESFNKMVKTLNIVQGFPLISENDRMSIDRYKSKLIEKQDELAGRNGFTRVSDRQINAFSDYVVQDTEQAEVVITISLLAVVLIVLLVLWVF